jgi:hypothetical protein
MKNFLIFLMISIFAFPAVANIGADDISPQWNQLTPQQQAEMAQLIAQKAAAGSTTLPDVEPEEVEGWLKLVDKVGEGLIKLAHDLGVEANELLKTPVGMMTMGLVVYSVMGEQILELATGMIWFFLTFPILVAIFYKMLIPVQGWEKVQKNTLFRGVVECDVPVRRRVCFKEDANNEWVFLVLFVLQMLITITFIA